jgi:hypothetical protein
VKGSRGWWIFKHRKENAAAQATPSASPTPHKHRAKPQAETATGADLSKPPAEVGSGETATPTPAKAEATPQKEKESGMTSQVPFVPTGPGDTGDQQTAPVVETKSPVEIEAEETAHFQAAKKKALEDQHVQELQAKADSAMGDEAKAASKRYYKALYDKMREVDPSVKDRIDRTEAATLKRVDAEATEQ